MTITRGKVISRGNRVYMIALFDIIGLHAGERFFLSTQSGEPNRREFYQVTVNPWMESDPNKHPHLVAKKQLSKKSQRAQDNARTIRVSKGFKVWRVVS